ncbi:MAG: Na+/H+ antiporter subunit E [Trueperaceae bacterium]
MNLFALNLMLAFVWALATGSLSEVNLVIGFLVGMGVLQFVGGALGDARYTVRFLRAIGLALFFLKELLLSSVRVAIDVIRPEMTMTPAVIAVPLDVTSDAEITLLANLISLTPGTLSLDVADDKSCLYVHAMYGSDPERLAQEIKSSFERRIQEVFR